MRRVLSWIGGGVLLLVVAGIAAIGYWAVTGTRLDNSGRVYADAAVRPVVEHWDANALKARASPQLLAATPADKIGPLFQWLSSLGALKDLQPCSGQVNVFVDTRTGRTVTGRYVCKARFEDGNATIQVLLIQIQGDWRIAGFHVDSPALIPQAPNQKI